MGHDVKSSVRQNIILSCMDEVIDMSQTICRKPDIWHLFWARAYAYYHLILRGFRSYHPCRRSGISLQSSRKPMQTACVRRRMTRSSRLCLRTTDLSWRAWQYLPETQPNSSFGRPTQGATRTIARLRLIREG